MGTIWGGKLRITAPFLFAVGFVGMFTIGGLSGVTHAVVPADTQQTDTYYIVAHFHYVMFGGSIFGLFAGIYYWYPKIAGKLLSDSLGKVHFWLMLIGFNLTFGPMHILGLQGQPRRIYTYPAGRGWEFWNLVSTIGAFTIALSIVVFIVNVIRTTRSDQPNAGADPWDARTLEWTIPSPPPVYNFAEEPLVTARDELWHRKYDEDEEGRAIRRELDYPVVMDTAPDEVHVHMPSPSYWPVMASFSLPVIAYGMIYRAWPVAIAGAVLVVAALYSWALEPQTAPPDEADGDGHGPELGSGEAPAGELEPAGAGASADAG